jgi:hypothetical protein
MLTPAALRVVAKINVNDQKINGRIFRNVCLVFCGTGIAAALMTIIVTLLTISFVSIRAANINPIKSLKSE